VEEQLHGTAKLPVGIERSVMAEKDASLLRWFSEQIEVSERNFGQYLRFVK
jgi:hypothetical protein